MTGPSVREFLESPWEQGREERRSHRLDTAQWPGTGAVTNVVNVLLESGTLDVSGTKLAGAPTVNAAEITTSLIIDLEPGKWYRLEVKYDKGGQRFEGYGIINAKE